ncbi:MAG TPA: DMT family transporter [Synergistaceae bacterium]|nr:DMT family transporter [Synergistaceae bacterium]
MTRTDTSIPALKALAAVIIWGASFVGTKAVLRELDPLTLIWSRFALGAAVLMGIQIFRKKLTLPRGKELLLFPLLALQGVTFHQWLQCVALQTAKASTSGWIIATSAIFMTLLGWAFLGEKIRFKQLGGMVLATTGLFLVLSDGNPLKLLGGNFGSFGDALMLLSAANWALFSVFSRSLLRRSSPGNMMAWVIFFGWVFSALLFAPKVELSLLFRLSSTGFWALLILGIFCTGMAYSFWYDALEAMEASRVGAFMYLEPPAAVIIAFLFLGEPLLPLVLAGGGMILLGVWLVNRF